MRFYINVTLVTTLIFIFCLTLGQDLECEADTCEKAVFKHSSAIKINCPYLNILFKHMNESLLLVGTFRMCTKTKILDLSNNAVKIVKAGAFLGLSSLAELYMSNNEIEEIEPGTFHTLTNLEIFVLTGNKITTLPEYEFTSRNLKYFNLNHNNLQALPSTSLLHLKSIDLLDLSMNQMNEINPNALINVEPGGTIILNNNRLLNITLKFNTTFLRGNTNFQAIGNALRSLKNGSLGELYKLKLVSLDLSFNYIDEVEPGVFGKMDQLKNLFLSHNHIEILDEYVFLDLNSLNTIDLSYNRLSTKAFEIMLPPGIQYVNFSNNVIEGINDYNWIAHTGKKGVVLNLNNNRLSYIDTNRFCSNINEVALSYNDWTCSVLYNAIKNLERRHVHVVKGVEYKGDNVNGIPCKLDANKLAREGSIVKLRKPRPPTVNRTRKYEITRTAAFSRPVSVASSAGIVIKSVASLVSVMIFFSFKVRINCA